MSVDELFARRMSTMEIPVEAPPVERRRDLAALNVRVDAFVESHLPLVAAFSERYWSRPRTAEYYRWRYLDSQSFSRMFLALTDDECLGMINAFSKPYLIKGERTACLEIFDWHSLPGLSGSGIGIRVMRAMMRQNARVIGIGGTSDAQKALPVMGWQNIGSAVSYELPLTGESLTDGLRRRVSVRIPGERLLLNAAAAWFTPRRRHYRGRAIEVPTLGADIQTLYEGDTGYDLVQMPDYGWLRWLTSGYSPIGTFRLWHFMVEDRLRGWALTRVYDTDQGKEAALIELFAPRADRELYAWMVSETAAALAADRPRLIRARASCPVLQSALRLSKFREADASPVFTYPKMSVDATRLHVTLNHTDACLRPYPTGG